MKTFFFYLELVLTILIGFCGVALLIGGIFMNSVMSIVLGIAGIIFPVMILIIDRKK